MNLNAIRKLCLRTKRITLFDAGAEQWLCNGNGAWLVEGVRLEESGLAALLDLTEKQREEFQIKEWEAPDERWSSVAVEGEEPLTELGTIWYDGRLYSALRSARGTLFVPVDLIKPVRLDEDYQRFFARWSPSGTPLVAVYGDLLCQGLAVPADNVTAGMILAAAGRILHETAYSWPDPDRDAADAEAAAEEMLKQMKIDDIEGEDDGGESD